MGPDGGCLNLLRVIQVNLQTDSSDGRKLDLMTLLFTADAGAVKSIWAYSSLTSRTLAVPLGQPVKRYQTQRHTKRTHLSV